MIETRKLSKIEIKQAEILSASLAEALDKVCTEQEIDNFGVVSSAFLILLVSLIIECLEEDERKEAVKIFFEHANSVIDLDNPPAPQVN